MLAVGVQWCLRLRVHLGERSADPAGAGEPTAAAATGAKHLGIGDAGQTDESVQALGPLAAERDLSPSTLDALHSSIEDYWRRDDEHGGETYGRMVVGQLRYVVDLLKEQRPAPMRASLHSIAAELARLTGWTYFDARQYNQARAYFTESLGLAKLIEDHQFMANVLACMSLQATYQDKPGDALALVTAAQDQARTAGGRRRACWPCSRCAKPSSTPSSGTTARPTPRSRKPTPTSAGSAPPIRTQPGLPTSTSRS